MTMCQVDSPHTGRIYFAKIGNGVTKIGYSSRLGQRLQCHKRDVGQHVEVLFSVPGSLKREKAFHEHFADYRMALPNGWGMKGAPEHFRIPDNLLISTKEILGKEGGFSEASVPDVRLSIAIPAELHARLKRICFRRKISQQQIFEAALNLWLTAQGEPGLESVEKREKEGAQ